MAEPTVRPSVLVIPGCVDMNPEVLGDWVGLMKEQAGPGVEVRTTLEPRSEHLLGYHSILQTPSFGERARAAKAYREKMTKEVLEADGVLVVNPGIRPEEITESGIEGFYWGAIDAITVGGLEQAFKRREFERRDVDLLPIYALLKPGLRRQQEGNPEVPEGKIYHGAYVPEPLRALLNRLNELQLRGDDKPEMKILESSANLGVVARAAIEHHARPLRWGHDD